LNNESKKIIIWRTASSGGWHTQRLQKGITDDSGKDIGDIRPIEPEADELFTHFSIECKFYKEVNLFNFIKGNIKDELIKDYNKILNQSKDKNKDILFIMKINRKGTYIISSKKLPMNELVYFYNLPGYMYYYDDLFDIDFEKFITDMKSGDK
jgi:hypothetical protein